MSNGLIFLSNISMLILSTDEELTALPSDSAIAGSSYFSAESGLYYFDNNILNQEGGSLIADDNGGTYIKSSQNWIFINAQNQISNLNINSALSSGYIEVGNSENLATPVPFSGAISLSNTGNTTINNNIITNNNIQNSTITGSKIASGTITGSNIASTTIIPSNLSLANGEILVGNSSNQAASVIMHGNASIDNTGNVTINSISPSNITLTNNYIFVGDSSNTATQVLMNGDATLVDTGEITIGTGVVTGSKIASATITGSNIASSTILGANIANTTITPTNISLASSNLIVGNISNQGASILMNGGASMDNTGFVTINSVSPSSITLNDGQIFVGNISNQAAPVTMSGDATLTNTGVLTISNAAVTGTKIASATITGSNIASTTITPSNLSLTNGDMLVGNGSSQGAAVAMSGDATLTNAGVLTISNAAVTGTKIASATITGSNIASTTITPSNLSLTSAQIIVGNASNQGAAVTMSGNATISNTGALTISNNTILGGMIVAATIPPSKISITSGNIIVGNSSNQGQQFTMSGDATISNAGVITIGNSAITTSKIATGAVTVTCLDTGLIPAYIVVYGGTISSSSSTSTFSSTISGVLSTDLCVVNLISSTASPFPACGGSATANTLNIKFSLPPLTFSASYLIFRPPS